MSLTIQPSKQTGSASSEIKGHNVTYTYEHETGQKPAFISASGLKKDAPAFNVGVAYASGNINISLYGGANQKAIDLTIIAEVINQIKEVYDQV